MPRHGVLPSCDAAVCLIKMARLLVQSLPGAEGASLSVLCLPFRRNLLDDWWQALTRAKAIYAQISTWLSWRISCQLIQLEGGVEGGGISFWAGLTQEPLWVFWKGLVELQVLVSQEFRFGVGKEPESSQGLD